jgi:hypothetical protein
MFQCRPSVNWDFGWRNFLMARLPKDIVVMSQPVRTFENGDYFYLELCRRNSRYECSVRMVCSGNPENAVVMARGQGKTIREAEDDCCQRALARCPSFPRPPYFKRGEKTRRVAHECRTTTVVGTSKSGKGIAKPA